MEIQKETRRLITRDGQETWEEIFNVLVHPDPDPDTGNLEFDIHCGTVEVEVVASSGARTSVYQDGKAILPFTLRGSVQMPALVKCPIEIVAKRKGIQYLDVIVAEIELILEKPAATGAQQPYVPPAVQPSQPVQQQQPAAVGQQFTQRQPLPVAPVPVQPWEQPVPEPAPQQPIVPAVDNRADLNAVVVNIVAKPNNGFEFRIPGVAENPAEFPIAIWPCQRQRICFNIENKTKIQHAVFTIEMIFPSKRGDTSFIRVKSVDGLSTIDNGGYGHLKYDLTADRFYPHTAQDKEVPVECRITIQGQNWEHRFKLKFHIKAAPAVSLTGKDAGKAARAGSLLAIEEAPTRFCLVLRNQYKLKIENQGNAATAVRLEIRETRDDGKENKKKENKKYDYVFDRQLVNLEFDPNSRLTTEVNLRVYHRESRGRIFSKHEFEVLAVPVTDSNNYASVAPLEGAEGEKLANRIHLKTVKLQLPLWLLVSGIWSFLLFAIFLLLAPEGLRVESNDPKIPVVAFDDLKISGKHFYAVFGNPSKDEPLEAVTKWNARFLTWFSHTDKYKDQKWGFTWQQQTIGTPRPHDKSDTADITYTVAPLIHPFGWGSRSVDVRYYFTNPDVKLEIRSYPYGKLIPIDAEGTVDLTVHREVGDPKRYVRLLFVNNNTLDVQMSCWWIKDELSEKYVYIENEVPVFTPVGKGGSKRFGFALQNNAPKGEVQKVMLFTSDPKHPVIQLQLHD